MATLRIVLEFEQDEATITPALLEKFWPESESDEEERKLGLESELALLAAVTAQPEIVRQFWLREALFWVYWLENPDIHSLLKPVMPARMLDLEPLVAELPEYARKYFIEYGMLHSTDHELLFRWVKEMRLRRIKVEDAEGVMLSSDDPPIRRTKKKK